MTGEDITFEIFKTFLFCSTGLVAFTITFHEKMLGGVSWGLAQRVLVATAWCLLLLCAVGSIMGLLALASAIETDLGSTAGSVDSLVAICVYTLMPGVVLLSGVVGHGLLFGEKESGSDG